MTSAGPTLNGSLADVTAVVIPLLGGDFLRRLVRQLDELGMPCLIVARTPGEAAGLGGHRTLVSDTSVPLRRALGFRETSSTWVLLVEDTCVLGEAWPDCLRALADRPEVDAVAGPIVLAENLPPRFMALACVEYGEFGPARMRAAASDRLPGLCVCYRRAAVPVEHLETALIEPEVQSAILARRRTLRFDDRFQVTYDAQDAASARWRQRFSHGRIFGGTLRRHASLPRRMKSIFGAPALPFLLAWRAVKGIPRDYARRFQTAAYIIHYTIAWTLGEVIGVVSGSDADTRHWH